jgi:hypothetical protein
LKMPEKDSLRLRTGTIVNLTSFLTFSIKMSLTNP